MNEFAIEQLKRERVELARLQEQLPRTRHWSRYEHLVKIAAINQRIADFLKELDGVATPRGGE